MNARLTMVLLVVVLVFGGYLAFRPATTSDGDPTILPWFYLVEDTKIFQLDVNYFGEELTFIRDDSRVWHLGTVEGPAVNEEFLGTPFLAGGTRSPRLISQGPDPDLALYGLDDPKFQLGVSMDDGKSYLVLLGDLTPDRINNYARIEGFSEVYLVDRAWGEHMARLVTDTPVNTPTPVAAS